MDFNELARERYACKKYSGEKVSKGTAKCYPGGRKISAHS